MDEDKEVKVSPILMEIAVAVAVALAAFALVGSYLGGLFEAYRAFIARAYEIWAVIRIEVAVIVTLLNIVLIGFIARSLRRFFKIKNQPPLFLSLGGHRAPGPATALAEDIGGEWSEIRALTDSSNASDWNMAVLRADALLDDALQRMGHEGNTVKERLDFVDPTRMPSRERAYSAHRLRNMIAHDPMIAHTKETIEEALRSYERVFRELGVLGEKTAQVDPHAASSER